MASRADTGTRVDFSRTGVARYIQLASLFRRRIESGLWAPGRQIPIVDDLAAECGVARATIRQALGILENERLIERYRAKGTFVLERPQGQIWCEVATDWSGLLMSRKDAVIEVLSDARIHPIQYLLLGAALTVFYLLELSLAEHLGFALAYAIAATSVLGLVTAYSAAILRTGLRAALVGSGVAALYGYLYVLLTNEDYALLIGSIGLFAAVAGVMLATRRIDWYAPVRPARPAP